MSNEAYEIGNGQTCQMRLGDVCGSLDCMHDQKAILNIGGGQGHEPKNYCQKTDPS